MYFCVNMAILLLFLNFKFDYITKILLTIFAFFDIVTVGNGGLYSILHPNCIFSVFIFLAVLSFIRSF